MRICCNAEHPKDQPQPVRWVVMKHDTPYFLCEACAWVLDHIAGFYEVQDLEEWEEEQLSPEERRRRDWEEWGDREYHRLKDEGEGRPPRFA